MRLIVVAAGTKLPDWVNAGFSDYAGRFTRDYKLELKEIALGQRGGAHSPASAIAKEGAVDTGANLFEIYQITDKGAALQATVAGTKYWKDKELNK